MKKNARNGFALLLAAITMLAMGACPTDGDNDNTNPTYAGFYNYPTGRKDNNGLLKISNNVAAEVLLFTSEATKENYIGTVGSLSSINVRLSEEKFYTIVAVRKSDYEENSSTAARFSDLTYYSNTQPYSLTVTASEMGGAGQWIIDNNTEYWVSFKKSDQSGTVYAVAAPKASRVVVPVAFNKSYDYIPHFYRQLKYNGNVVALVEFDDNSQSNTIYTTSASPTNRTTIGGTGNTNPTGSDINPAILFTNSSDKNVRIYLGVNNQLTNGGMVGTDFVVTSGNSYMFTSTANSTTQLIEGISTNTIRVYVPGLQGDVIVSQNTIMQKNKVYHVTLNGSGGNYTTTVIEKNASEYFN